LHVLAKQCSKSTQFLFYANLKSICDECITCVTIRLYFAMCATTDFIVTKRITYGVKTYNKHNCITHMLIRDDLGDILHILAKQGSKSNKFKFYANTMSIYDECITCVTIRLYFAIDATTHLLAT
jgi:hypothetical protein